MRAAYDVIAKSGLVMIPLALCSVLALAVLIECAVVWLRMGGTDDADRVLALASRGRWDEAAGDGAAVQLRGGVRRQQAMRG